MKVDFHCHTTASDGGLSPKEIIDLALKHEVTTLAITDHDTTAGYEQALDYATENNIQLISGVEASCTWNGHTIHIVGLDFDIENPVLQAGLASIRELRLARANSMLERLADKPHIKIDSIEEKLWNLVGHGVVGRGHFSQLLQQEGLVKNGQQAFDRYLKKGKVGHVGVTWPELSTVVNWITQANGIAVIAHPAIYKFTSNKLNRLISDFKQAGGQAIEVVNQPRHCADINGMAQRAVKNELYASMGSDFHRPEHSWRGLGWLAPMPQTVRPVWELFKNPLKQA
ncbi:phosphatase [Thiomicrorhabdus immobilis]|uniref:Phosphatase n=1 Tax=Thiomicrorhabdus immobilis TaxID=2791037 RepID=A0ABM7MD86_9GAMM|nr:PHP domain-containing protein [Thiomicrorhabdus immobilis]BCN93386.1 phosphatase [Thiomicrorhabdus immobilis]